MHNSTGPKAAGCLVTREDIPLMIASGSVYCACIARGCCIAILAASIPEMSKSVDKDSTAFGELFTSRGIGFFLGTLIAAAVVESVKVNIPKHIYVCVSILITGAASMMFSVTNSFLYLNALAFGQGLGFGGVHTFTTLALMEMWGQRCQPWMQIKPTAMGLGGVLGPMLVSFYGYKTAFFLASLLCASTLLLLMLEYLVPFVKACASGPCCNPSTKGQARTPLFPMFFSLWTRGTYLSEELKVIEAGMEQQMSRNFSETDPQYSVSQHLDSEVQNTNTNNSNSHSIYAMPINPGLTINITPPPSVPPFEVSRVLAEVMERRMSIDDSEWMVANAVAVVLRSPRGSIQARTPSRANRTLSFATPTIVDRMAHMNSGIVLIPTAFRYLLAVLVFFYFGFIHSYSGWVSSYSIILGVAKDSSQAATLTSVYYSWMTLGSVVSIPCAVWISTTSMLRFQLAVVLTGVCILVTLAGTSFYYLELATAVMGFGNSCIFPLILCLCNDYGFTMDTPATTFLVLSATMGEAAFPILVGSALKTLGAIAFPGMSVLLTGLMVVMYAIIHFWGWEAVLRSANRGSERGYVQLSQIDEEVANTISNKGQ